MKPDFLNNFLSHAWPLTADAIRCISIHEGRASGIDEKTGETKYEMPLDRITVNLTPAPHFSKAPDIALPGGRTLAGGFIFQMPRNGKYKFHAEVIAWGVSVPVDIEFSASLRINRNHDNPLVTEINVSSNVIGDFVGIFEDWKSQIENTINKSLESHMGFFRTMVFNDGCIPSVPTPKLLFGNKDLRPDGAIDVFLVADGFTHNKMGDFRSVSDAIVNKLTSDACRPENEPFLSFRSLLRIWSLEVETQADATHRVITESEVSGSWKVALSNLAIMETIGRKADLAGARVVAFLSDGQAFQHNPRAMGIGNVVLLPIARESAEEDARTFLHELGHTRLGHLADEYDVNGHSGESYYGPDPVAANVTSVTAPLKWVASQRQTLPAWDKQPIGAPQEGAFYFKKGLYRPAANCRMRESQGTIGFCAVCRDQLTMNILVGLRPQYLFELREAGAATPSLVNVSGFDTLAGVLPLSKSPTTVSVRLLAGHLPEPWRLTYAASGSSDASVRSLPGNQCEFSGRDKDLLTITVKSDCPYTSASLGSQTILLSIQSQPSVPLAAPFNLRARATRVSKGNPNARCTLFASAVAPLHSTVRFQLEFKRLNQAFKGQANGFSEWEYVTQQTVSCMYIAYLPIGSYKFQARIQSSAGDLSAWSQPCTFTVLEGPVP